MTDSQMEHVAPTFKKAQPKLLVGILLALLGVGLSVYSTWHHMELKANGHTSAFCNISQTVNCDTVAASAYSELFGVPLGVWGIGYFLANLVLLGSAWASAKRYREHMSTYVVAALVGGVVSLVLGYFSWFKVQAACPTCMAIYAVCLAQIGLIFSSRSTFFLRPAEDSPGTFKELLNGGLTIAAVTAFTIVIFQFVIPKKELPHAMRDEPGKVTDHSQSLYLGSRIEDIPIARSAYSGLGEDYRKGSDGAKVVIVEFVDLQCPSCAGIAVEMEKLLEIYPQQVQVVFRNYPLNSNCNPSAGTQMHASACVLAIMARCAGQYGKFWPYVKNAFQKQSQASEKMALTWAEELGLTAAQIEQCRTAKDILEKIKDDANVGTKLGVQGTPSVYMNGRKYLGNHDVNSLRQAVESLF